MWLVSAYQMQSLALPRCGIECPRPILHPNLRAVELTRKLVLHNCYVLLLLWRHAAIVIHVLFSSEQRWWFIKCICNGTKRTKRLDVHIAQPAILFGAESGPDTRFQVPVVARNFIILKFTDFIYNLAILRFSREHLSLIQTIVMQQIKQRV